MNILEIPDSIDESVLKFGLDPYGATRDFRLPIHPGVIRDPGVSIDHALSVYSGGSVGMGIIEDMGILIDLG